MNVRSIRRKCSTFGIGTKTVSDDEGARKKNNQNETTRRQKNENIVSSVITSEKMFLSCFLFYQKFIN